MMNSTSMHKTVVGIGLAAVIGVGVCVFAVRAKHESEVARNTPAPAMLAPGDENATDAAASAQSAAAQPTDETAPASSAPPSAAAVSDVANDAAGAAAGEESRPVKSKASDRADRRVAKTRDSSDSLGTRVASAASSNTGPADERDSISSDSMRSHNEPTPAPSSSDTLSSAPAGAGADAQQDSAQTRQEAATSSAPAATSIEPLPSDSQITAYVKSEIATATPNSSVDVTTTDGVVALSGSVPSQDAVEQARRAAQRVPGVKQVDASGLTVTNQ
jgi:hyperosmotically inducible periplasmic protein